MKKIISVVLATALLSSMAFAANLGVSMTEKPGGSFKATAGQFEYNGIALDANALSYRFSNENFSISAKTFSKGGNLVTDVVINDDKEVEVKLKKDYNQNLPASAPNIVIKKLAVKAKTNLKDSANLPLATKGREYVLNISDAAKELRVGFTEMVQAIDNGEATYTSGEMTKFGDEKNAAGVTTPSDAYGTATLSGEDIYLSGRVYKGDKVFIEVVTSPSDEAKAIMKDPSNDNAEMRFAKLNTNGLPSNHEIQLTAEEDEFIYKIVDGKLTASGLKWSPDDFAWIGKVRSSVEYVISDMELKASAVVDPSAPTVNPNPDTGANDVVGIAAALAVVSLVAAGAVSMKK